MLITLQDIEPLLTALGIQVKILPHQEEIETNLCRLGTQKIIFMRAGEDMRVILRLLKEKIDPAQWEEIYLKPALRELLED